MWALPQTLEILNISNNQLKKLNPEVMRTLSNLTTLELSKNGLESLDGIQTSRRLKRLISKNNYVQYLEPLSGLEMLIEVDLENNLVDSSNSVLKFIKGKKDILVLNLKLAPLIVKVQNYEEFIQELESQN